MDAVLGQYLTQTVIVADDAGQARAIAERLREEAAHPPLALMLQTIRTIDDVLPGDQTAKIDEARAIREDLTPRIRSLIPEDKRAAVMKMLGDGYWPVSEPSGLI